MKKVITFTSFLILCTAPAMAGSCALGPAAYNLINSYKSPQRSYNFEETIIVDPNINVLSIVNSIDLAQSWQKSWAWKRNLLGFVEAESVHYMSKSAEKAGLNSRFWGASLLDSDTILSAKMNVINSANYARLRGYLILGMNSTENINSVTVANAEAAAYQILSNVFVLEFRKAREYYYAKGIQDILRKKYPGTSLGSINQIRYAFNQDHPRFEDDKDVAGLKTLIMTRLPAGESLFNEASRGKLDTSAIYQITGRPFMRGYFTGVCIDAIR